MNQKWDLFVIDELFAFHGMGIAAMMRKYYDVPYISFSTSQIMQTNTVNFGMGRLL
jgi:hypothetical protein